MHCNSFIVFVVILQLACANYSPPAMTEEPQNAFANEGQDLTLKCRATGTPPPEFIWIQNGKELEIDGRLKLSVDGDLTIEKFNPADDVGIYTCKAIVKYNNLELVLLSREAKIQSTKFPSVFKQDVSTQTGYVGGAMRLSVDASNFIPAPMIGWNYRGKPAIRNTDTRFFVLPQGVLQINNMRTSDSGEIRAIARSRSTSGTKKAQTFTGNFAQLTVESDNARPSSKGFYFLGTPQNVELAWGRSTILEACADSANAVSYKWYKDGNEIQLDDRRSIVGKGNLKLLYVKEEDSGDYKVVATSAGQTLESTAKVTVVSPPQFTLIPPKRVYGQEDGTVKFDFKVVGFPKPKIVWFRDSVLVDAAADFVEFGENYLIIKDLIKADSGMYQARASNAGGDAQMSLELLVQPPGTVTTPVTISTPSKPRNIQAYAKSSTAIALSWLEPSITNGPIIGYQIIYFTTIESAEKITIEGNTRFLTISNLIPDSTYKFRLQALNSDSTGPLSDIVSAKTLPNKTPITEARNIQSYVSGTQLRLSWDIPSSGKPTSYKVYYQNIHGGAVTELETSLTSIVIPNLLPDATYKYWVTPYADGTPGIKSQESLVTIPSAPVLPPNAVQNVVITPVLSDVVNVKWTPPRSGPRPDNYTVYYQNIDDNSAPLQTLSTTATTVMLKGLVPYANYIFYVIPSVKGSSGRKSAIRSLRMLEEVPPAPATIQSVSVSSTSIKVKWDPIAQNSFRGKLVKYKILYYEYGRQAETLRSISDIPISVTEWKIENLKPLTMYNVKVSGVSGSGMGDSSNILTVKTRDKTKIGPSAPTGFKGVHHANVPDSIMITWNEPQFITGSVNSYILYYRQVGSLNWSHLTLTGNSKGYNITNFEFGETYECYVVATDNNGEGKNSQVIRINTMQENVRPPPPVNVVVIPKPDSLSVSWKPPAETPPVVVRGYHVKIVASGSGKEIFDNKLPERTNTNIQLYNNIEPDTLYELTIWSYNDFGNSNPVVRRARTLAVVIPAIYIESVDKKADSIFFKWTDSLQRNNINYEVRYKSFDVNGVPNTILKTTVVPEITIAGLTPYTTYKFFVKRKSDANFPALPTLECKTLEAVPSKPLDVTARGVSKYPTWLILSWQVPRHPNGKIKEYVILYTADRNLPLNKWSSVTSKDASMYHNVTGLAAGTSYQFVLYAVNGAGEGEKSVVYSKRTGGVYVPGGGLPSTNGGDGGGGNDFELWWILLIIILIILLILLILLIIYCCCCKRNGLLACFACCPCCKKCWFCCCLPWCLCCCPCCCKEKKKTKDQKTYIAAPITIIGGEEKASNGHAEAPPDLWMTGKKDQIELMPLTSAAHESDLLTARSARSSMTGPSLSRQTSKSSIAKVKVPIPGDTTFISYKTSLQDYCQKVGWLAPIYTTTTNTNSGYISKVSFGGSTYGKGDEFGSSRQEAEQKAAHTALIELGVLDLSSKYANDASISVPSPGDASFISYKCSLHDFCQQCNILPPRFSTSKHDNGYGSSVQVGSHTFNMPGRVRSSQEAEQKVACISLQGLCMTDSQSGYYPESCFTVPGPGDSNFISFKSSLHDFCQRYKLPPPQYITNQSTQGYSARLKFGGLFFQSSDYFQTRLEAEQHAAFEALQGLGLLESLVEFGAALESNQTAGPSGGVSLTHGSGIVTVGHMGGSVPTSYSTSRHGSRTGSRPPSRPGSRPASRPSSRPGSRQGSMTQLNQTFGGGSSIYASPRDPQFSIGQRSYSSGGGFHGHDSSYSSFSHGYDDGGYKSTFSNGTLPNNTGTIPRTRSKSFGQNNEINQIPNNGTSFQYSMTYQHTTSTTTTTLPKKATNASASYSQHDSPTRGYGSVQNVSHEYEYHSTDTRSASHPALSDLESEMAGLEGLIKDLNGITNSGKMA